MFKDEPWTEEKFDMANEDPRYRDKYDEWNEDTWWVLSEKTTGEALLRVKGVEQGQGMEAYRRLHQWFGKQADMGLAELRQRVIRPNQAKREDDIACCTDAWNTELEGSPAQDTDASRRGMFYRAANDSKIAIHGRTQ